MKNKDTAKAEEAQKQAGYSASEANKNNQKDNARPTGKKPREGRDPMEGDEDGNDVQ